MPSEKAQTRRSGKADSKPWLEWTASTVGLLIALALMSLLAWNAFHHDGRPPAVLIEVGRILQQPNGYTVEIQARNAGSSTAANVQVEGTLTRDGQHVETARARLDFVPAHSVRRGGLFFTNDPKRHDLQVRALGYAEP
jgi:uncharacterized protein (TIGR02588 family)